MSTIWNINPAVAFVAASLALAAPVCAAPVDHEALMADRPAPLLSAYALFADPRRQLPNDRLEPYSVTNPLFSDHAEKYRFVYLPEGATPAPFSLEGALAFPVGAVLVKTFAFPADFAAPGTDLRLVETRLLIHKPRGWEAWAYVWNEAMTDAELKIAGKRLDIPVKWADGTVQTISYHVPTVLQCKGCHGTAAGDIAPIGPKVRNLNDVRAYPDGTTRNQLERLALIGYLDALPADPAALPRIPRSFDPHDGTLAERARGYLDGNCAHCHAPGLPADTSGLYLDFGEDRPVRWGVKKRPVAAGRGSGGLQYDIHPGHPDRSILLYRMTSDDPGERMPELGRSIVDRDGVALIADFIESLDESDF